MSLRPLERRRLSRDDRRAELVGATRAILAEHGYHGVSVPRIVAAAGVSQGTFYRYFENLDLALRQVVDEALAPLIQLTHEIEVSQIQTAAQLEEVLLRYYRALFTELARQSRLIREVVVVLPTIDGEAGDAARSFLRAMRQHTRAALASVNGRAPFRAMDPQIVGSAIVGMVIGAAQQMAELGPAFAIEAWAMEMAKLEAHMLLRGEVE